MQAAERCSLAAGSIFDSLAREEQAPWKARLSLQLEGLQATIFVSAVTFVALFLEDLRLAVFPPAADIACQVLSGLVMVRHSCCPPSLSDRGGGTSSTLSVDCTYVCGSACACAAFCKCKHMMTRQNKFFVLHIAVASILHNTGTREGCQRCPHADLRRNLQHIAFDT